MPHTPTAARRMNSFEAHRKVYQLSEMWMIAWGLLIWTLALNQSPYNPWEQFVILPLSLICSQVCIRLARRCILGRHFLEAIDRCKFARERILKDFGLSVSAARELLPKEIKHWATIAVIAGLVACSLLCWTAGAASVWTNLKQSSKGYTTQPGVSTP
jgi:hypothetical protein